MFTREPASNNNAANRPVQVAPVPTGTTTQPQARRIVHRRHSSAAAAIPAIVTSPTNNEEGDDETINDESMHLDEMEGRLSHHEPKTVDFGRSAGAASVPKRGIGRGAIAAGTTSIPEGEAVRMIGQYTAPTGSGYTFSQASPLDNQLSRNVDGSAPQSVRKLDDLLEKWTVGEEERRELINNVIGVFGGTRTGALDLLVRNLERVMGDKEKAYGPNWVTSTLRRQYQIEKHPYFVFSQLVENGTLFAQATLHIRHAAENFYLPYLRNIINDRSDLLKAQASRVKIMEDIEKRTRSFEVEFQFMRDHLLETSLPLTGIDINKAITELKGYLKKVILLSAAAAAADPAVRDPRPNLEIVVREHNKIFPEDVATFLNVVFRGSDIPWSIVTEPVPINDQARRTFGRTYSTDYLRNFNLQPEGDLDILLGQAVRTLTQGPLGQLGNERKNKADLAITGQFIKFAKDNFVDKGTQIKLEKRNGRVYLAPTIEGGPTPPLKWTDIVQGATTGGNEIRTNGTVLYVSLTPFTPGVFTTLDAPGPYYQIDKADLLRLDPLVARIDGSQVLPADVVKRYFTALDQNLLDPNNGAWTNIQLQINNPNTEIQQGKQKLLTISAYLEMLRQEISDVKYDTEPDTIKTNLRAFIRDLRSGKNINELVAMIDKLIAAPVVVPANGTNNIREQFKNDSYNLPAMMEMLQDFKRALETKPGTRNARLIDFPIQYHIDARFTILYVLLQYEYVRSALHVVTEIVGGLVHDKFVSASNKLRDAQIAYDENSTSQDKDTVGSGLLTWSLLPQNTGIITLHPKVSAALDSAWEWLKENTRPDLWIRTPLASLDADKVIMGIESDGKKIAGVTDEGLVTLRHFLAEVVIHEMSAPLRNVTGVTPNTHSAPQLTISMQSASRLKVKAAKLNFVFKDPKIDEGTFVFQDPTVAANRQHGNWDRNKKWF